MAKTVFAPIELTLYDENDAPVKTYSKSVVRWGVLKKAIKLANEIGSSSDVDGETFDNISNFVCFLFDNQFTRDELENGADVGEIMTCFRAVVHRANALGNA